MPDYVLGILICLPYILAITALAIFWKRISNRFLYFVTAALALAGLQAWAAPGAIYVLFPGDEELTRDAVNDAFNRSVLVAAFIQVALGAPFLWWLRSAFRDTNLQFDTDASRRST